MLKQAFPLLVAGVVLAACGGDGNAPETAPTRSAAAVSPKPSPSPEFGSIAEAVRFLRAKVDVPILLPTDIPAGALPDKYTGIGWVRGVGTTGTLSLVFGDKQHLDINYGAAGWDGCGPIDPRPVRVLGHPALLRTDVQNQWARVVWPATLDHVEGRYGLEGSFSGHQLLRMARSMTPAGVVLRELHLEHNC